MPTSRLPRILSRPVVLCLLLLATITATSLAQATQPDIEPASTPADTPATGTDAVTDPVADASQVEEAGPGAVIVNAMRANAVLALFAIIGVGMLIGQVEYKGIGLGSSGVLFAALVAGHFLSEPGNHYELPSVVGTLGVVLFVYCVGISAGPSFFRAFAAQGKKLAQMAVLITLLGAAVTYIGAVLFDVPMDLAVGIYAGALTSTPALAAATETIKTAMPTGSAVSIGYGVAYPFGVAGVVLFVQLLPRLLGHNIGAIQESAPGKRAGSEVKRLLVEVTNPGVFGTKLVDVDFLQHMHSAATRVLRGDRLVPVTPDLVLEQGTHLWVVGTGTSVNAAAQFLGRTSDRSFVIDSENERQRIVVTSASMAGRPLGEIRPLRGYSVVVSRITRQDVDFTPGPETVVRPGDVLTVVGERQHLEQFAKAAGHRAKALDETDVISLSVGIVAGVLLGMVPINLGVATLQLGTAGGPLLVALVLGHFGRIGNIVGYIPRASRMLLTEIGLIFFLASAGAKAGGSFVEVVSQYGVVLFLTGVVVTLAPMLLGFLLARKFLGLTLLQSLGGVCGGMTSTPGLGAITAKTESESPVISYAAAYPVALILMTLCAKLLIAFLPMQGS